MSTIERRFRVELTELEMQAALEGMAEYLYLIEEGSLKELRSELGMEASCRALTVEEAHELKGRLESLLIARP
jgi:hypothetical protein